MWDRENYLAEGYKQIHNESTYVEFKHSNGKTLSDLIEKSNNFFKCLKKSYQAMSSTHTQSQLCTATPISSFAQCPISFRLFRSSVATFNLIEVFLR